MILSRIIAKTMAGTGMLDCHGVDGFYGSGFGDLGITGLLCIDSVSCRPYIFSRQNQPNSLV